MPPGIFGRRCVCATIFGATASLHVQCVLSQIGLIFVTDDITQLPHWLETETTGILVLALSCLLAWGLEWSYVSVVDCTSAMTMQVRCACAGSAS